VGVAGNGVDCKAGLFTSNTAEVSGRGPRRQVDLGHLPKDFREPIRDLHIY
jgi:hypothetical protein